jgi:hypothetical protein
MPIPKSWILFFLAVIAIVVAILLTQPEEPVTSPSPDPTEDVTRGSTFSEMLERGGNAIYVEDQLTDSSTVQVGFVVLSAPGFVVIYDDADGVPDSVIGFSGRLAEGGEHVVVSVDAPLEHDRVYYAMLYHDDGDGAFQEETDSQATDSEDSVILMSFSARKEATPESGAVSP